MRSFEGFFLPLKDLLFSWKLIRVTEYAFYHFRVFKRRDWPLTIDVIIQLKVWISFSQRRCHMTYQRDWFGSCYGINPLKKNFMVMKLKVFFFCVSGKGPTHPIKRFSLWIIQDKDSRTKGNVFIAFPLKGINTVRFWDVLCGSKVRVPISSKFWICSSSQDDFIFHEE